MMMEAKFTRRIGPLLSPGRQARLLLPPIWQEPPSFATTVNIVIKVLDQERFPIQSSHLAGLLNNLNQLNLLSTFIQRHVRNVVIRRFRDWELHLNPPAAVGHIVHKVGCFYALVLPNNGRLVLRHIQGVWFRAVAYFSNHTHYVEFLDIYYNINCTSFYY